MSTPKQPARDESVQTADGDPSADIRDNGAPELAPVTDDGASDDDDASQSTKPAKPRKGKERWRLFPVDDHPGIYRRGDAKKGRYVVVVRAGRGRQLKRTCRTLAEAIRMQAELRLSPPTANGHDKGATPFTKYALEWVATYSGAKRGRKIREQTRLAFEAALKRKEFKEAFGGVKLADVTVDHLEDYAGLLEDAGLKPPTVRNCMLPVRTTRSTRLRLTGRPSLRRTNAVTIR